MNEPTVTLHLPLDKVIKHYDGDLDLGASYDDLTIYVVRDRPSDRPPEVICVVLVPMGRHTKLVRE